MPTFLGILGPAASAVTILKDGASIINYCIGLVRNWVTRTSATDPEAVIDIKAPKIDDMPSFKKKVEKILKHLSDEEVKIIGVGGMVGVGKTTILQNLNNDPQVPRDFDMVIFATIRGGYDKKSQPEKEALIREFQREIAERLNLDIGGISGTKEIAKRIREKLESKKYLLLLDDVSFIFELSEIGFPVQVGSKMVLASRKRNILTSMNADALVEVCTLSDNDALKLFEEKLGSVKRIPNWEKVAQRVVRECCNLPLLIVTVAPTFIEKENINLWSAQATKFQNWSDVRIPKMDEVLEKLSFCYEQLDQEEEKDCFLYSALYPADRDIYEGYLLECWRADGLIRDMENNDGSLTMDKLTQVCLLERDEKVKHVKMNKVIQKLALTISSKEKRIPAKTDRELLEDSNVECWKQAKWISLVNTKSGSLPLSPDCDKLSTLLLQATFVSIQDDFFQSMPRLRLLDLYGAKVSELPSSISSLTSLRSLYLNSCDQLTQLPSDIHALQLLELLDVRNTRIHTRPGVLSRLTKFRCFRVSLPNFDGLEANQEEFCDVIKELSSLEELVIDAHLDNKWWTKIVKTIATEVSSSLTKLTSLSLYFVDTPNAYGSCIGHYCSTRYKILHYFEPNTCRCLKYVNGESVDNSIHELLAKLNTFELIGHKGARSLSDFGIASIKNIKSCLIDSCNNMKAVIDGNGTTDVVLESMEQMYICNVPKLETIWDGPTDSVPAGSLIKLTTLVISNCTKLNTIFFSGLIEQLSQLRHFEIESCHGVEEIFMETDNNPSGSFPNLNTVNLHDLPSLKNIWIDTARWDSLQKTITDCPPRVDVRRRPTDQIVPSGQIVINIGGP